MSNPLPQLPKQIGEAREIPLDDLLLDTENPRLRPETKSIISQEDLTAHIVDIYDALAVGTSIANYGFYPWEVLVVIPTGEKYTVVEGNRRLSALRCVYRLDDYRSALSNSTKWEQLAVKAGEEQQIPCVVITSRIEAVPALGYRHISGIKPWDPQMQSAYVTQLIDLQEQSTTQVGELVGKSKGWVEETYRTFKVKEAIKEIGVDTTAIDDDYSLLTVAMSEKAIREHIEFSGKVAERGTASLAKDTNKLEEVVTWIWGTDDKDPIVTDSRKIKNLAKIIAKPEGLVALRNNSTLDEAEQIIEDLDHDPLEQLRNQMLKAVRLLRNINVQNVELDESTSELLNDLLEEAGRLGNESDTADT